MCIIFVSVFIFCLLLLLLYIFVRIRRFKTILLLLLQVIQKFTILHETYVPLVSCLLMFFFLFAVRV